MLTKYVVRGMMADGAGRIVNVASIIGATGYSGLSAYAATKASMIGFTRSLAREVGRLGINVNAVAPGFLGDRHDARLRPRSPCRRSRGAPRSAASPKSTMSPTRSNFCSSDKARNITGTVLTVDAGATA